MESLKEHVKIATEMYARKLNLNFIKEFKIEQLENCYNEIDRLAIKKELYESYATIQKEMIKDTNTIGYLIQLHIAGIDLIKTRDFINILQSYGEKLTDYKVEKIIKALQDAKMYDLISYAYLKYFVDNIKSDLGKRIVIENLKYFFTQDDVTLQDLNNDEIKLFTSPILSNYNLIPRTHLKEVYELLVQNNELKKFILFLYLNKLAIPLKIEHYEKINKDTKKIHEYVYKLSKMIDNQTLYRLLLRWLENGCNLYELKIIETRISNLDKTILESMLSSRSGYINFIFGNKLSSLSLENIDETKEELIIYAISNNKKGFLKLIEQNKEDFLNIPSSSILYNKEFYSEYININALNSKNLKELRFMNKKRDYIYLLDKEIYTFNEIKTLYDSANKNCYKIYNYLLNLKIDDRILRIKQITNKNLATSNLSEDEIKNLSEKIKIKPLYNWIEQDFKEIKDIKVSDAVNILINYNDVSKFIKEIKDRNELLYILRNREILTKYGTLQEIKDNIIKVDQYWEELVKVMEFNQEFINKNNNNIKKFLLNNGAELALSYYRNCSSKTMKNSYKLIVKSEIMGEFKKLKYHTDDLKRELNFELEESQIKEWTINNISLQDGDIEVNEYDDFYSTMVLGEEPMRTCLSYKDGMYNRCLLACFDSNKKILYAKVNGKIVARAMVRLTKGTYQDIQEIQSLSFVDVENIDISDIEENKNEKLTIFLEKAYISGISTDLVNKAEKMFIEILENKAKRMNALLVLSNFYTDIVKKDYISTRYYMYISKSKAGSQYLDSLNGQATVSDEGQYKVNNFLIWKPKVNEESIFEESIFGNGGK